jgi:NO-binding membrane sensor protein with MHYT domain
MYKGDNLFWRLVTSDPNLGKAAVFQWDSVMVLLSVIVACVAGFATLMVMDRIQESDDTATKKIWLVVGSFAMGIGVWAMHFTGMLALIVTMAKFSFRVNIQYDLFITLLSIVPAVLGSGFAIHFMSWEPVDLNWLNLNGAALPLALGIGALHYIGMEAMEMQAHLRYDAWLFVLSIVVAHILALGALWVKFQFEEQGSLTSDSKDSSYRPARFWVLRTSAAVLIGLAVSGMHYTAMFATRIYPDPSLSQQPGVAFPPFAMGSVICVLTVFMLAVIVAGSQYYRKQPSVST